MDPRGYNFHDLQPVISVSDVGATVAHYRDTLGFSLDLSHGDPSFFARVSRDQIMIYFSKDDATFPPGSVKWYFIGLGHVDGAGDLDELYQEFIASGAKITMPPTIQPYGLREFEIEDPNQIKIRFHVDAD